MKYLIIILSLIIALAIPASAQLVLIGGTNTTGGGTNNESWNSTNGGVWAAANMSSAWAQRTNFGTVATSNGSVIILGGFDHTFAARNDVWLSADGGVNWVEVTAAAGWTPRYNFATVILPNDAIIVMGGYDGVLKNDTWVSTDLGATWTQVNSSSGWTERSSMAAAASGYNIVLTGGYDGGALLNDTWRSLDYGSTWIQVNQSGAWAQRYAHGMADLLNGDILLFGGRISLGAHTSLNDTWMSANYGATWTQVNASVEWGARHSFASARDLDGSVILGGGRASSGGALLNSTYRSADGGNVWRVVNLSPEWPARYGHGLASSFPPPAFTGNAVYGIVYNSMTGAGVNGSTATARNATAYAVNTTFRYGLVDGVYLIDKAVENEAVTLNATHAYYFPSADYTVNTGAAGTAIRQDLPIRPSFILDLEVRDYWTSALIAPQVVSIHTEGSLVSTTTTTTGLSAINLPYGLVNLNITSSGYYEGMYSYMMTTNRTEVVYLISMTSPAPQIQYNQQQIRIRIVDIYGNPQPGANVTVTWINSTLPSTRISWLSSAFGVSTQVASEMTNGSLAMKGWTDSGGAVVFMMFPILQYGIRITNTTTGLNHYTVLSPKDDDYVIYCPITGQKRNASAMSQLLNTSLYISEPNNSFITFNLQYNDIAGFTTLLYWNITCWTNRTEMYNKQFTSPGAGIILDNYTVKNIRGEEWRFWYNATRDVP